MNEARKGRKLDLHCGATDAYAEAVARETVKGWNIPQPPEPRPLPAIGEAFEGEGLFFMTYQNSLGQVFNVYASPVDLTDEKGERALLNYNDTVKRVSQLRDWHGHGGAKYTTDKALYAALETGEYKGEWVIPPCDFVIGHAVETPENVQHHSLYAHRHKGAFKGTYTIYEPFNQADSQAQCYWTSTPDPDGSAFMAAVDFSTDLVDYDSIGVPMGCRPIRLVPVPAGKFRL